MRGELSRSMRAEHRDAITENYAAGVIRYAFLELLARRRRLRRQQIELASASAMSRLTRVSRAPVRCPTESWESRIRTQW